MQDHVHAGQAAGGGVLLLAVERDRRAGLIADLEQQRAGAGIARLEESGLGAFGRPTGFETQE